MKLCSIASGSSGNCIFVGSDQTSLLVDAGISGKRVEQGLKALDRAGGELDGILITHEHVDHIQGIGVLARRYHVPLYGTKATLNSLANAKIGKIPEELLRPIDKDLDTVIGDITVHPFSISHDAADPVGYRLEQGGKALAVATDMGTYTDYIVENLKGLSALLLEANHDLRMLECGPYPYPLKRRVAGDKGHLSNEKAGQLLCQIIHDKMEHIYLGHLSKENNYPALAFETVACEVTLGDVPYKAADFHIEVAKRSEMTTPCEI